MITFACIARHAYCVICNFHTSFSQHGLALWFEQSRFDPLVSEPSDLFLISFYRTRKRIAESLLWSECMNCVVPPFALYDRRKAATITVTGLHLFYEKEKLMNCCKNSLTCLIRERTNSNRSVTAFCGVCRDASCFKSKQAIGVRLLQQA